MSTTEYRMSRRRTRAQDGEGSGPAIELPPLEEVAEPAIRRITGTHAAVATPPQDAWTTFEAETAEIDLPELAVPPVQGRVATPRNTLATREAAGTQPGRELGRVPTEEMPPEELAEALGVSSQIMDNAATLPSLSGQPAAMVVVTPEQKVIVAAESGVAVAFGDHQIGIIHRGDEVEIVLGALRLRGPRAGAAALAEALLAKP